jgi:hypothetical protein
LGEGDAEGEVASKSGAGEDGEAAAGGLAGVGGGEGVEGLADGLEDAGGLPPGGVGEFEVELSIAGSSFQLTRRGRRNSSG